jgi:hypothetical protein
LRLPSCRALQEGEAEDLLAKHKSQVILEKQVAVSDSVGQEKLEEEYIRELEATQMTPKEFFN